MRKLAFCSVAFALLGVACGDDDPDSTDATIFDVTLSPQSEVPACASASATATGTAMVVIAADRATISVDELTASGLSGPVTGAHIHAGARGVAGPVVFDLGTDPAGLSTRVFTSASYPAPVGAPATFEAFVAEMIAGNTYVNVHTAACPAGEIRAQLE